MCAEAHATVQARGQKTTCREGDRLLPQCGIQELNIGCLSPWRAPLLLSRITVSVFTLTQL